MEKKKTVRTGKTHLIQMQRNGQCKKKKRSLKVDAVSFGPGQTGSLSEPLSCNKYIVPMYSYPFVAVITRNKL